MIFKLASKVSEAHSNFTSTETFAMSELFGDKNKKDDSGEFHVLSYKGSLTTPGCNEVVTWLVSINPLPINSENLKLLRLLKDSKGQRMISNFRPMQSMNGRSVTFQ